MGVEHLRTPRDGILRRPISRGLAPSDSFFDSAGPPSPQDIRLDFSTYRIDNCTNFTDKLVEISDIVIPASSNMSIFADTILRFSPIPGPQ
jgi:hypothetical protein